MSEKDIPSSAWVPINRPEVVLAVMDLECTCTTRMNRTTMNLTGIMERGRRTRYEQKRVLGGLLL